MESKRSKYILLGLTLLCVLLIGVSSLKEGIMDPLRTGVGYLLVPIQSGVNAVGSSIYEELTDYAQLKTALEEKDNELLKKNADMLKMGTIETAREAERSVVDIQTLQHTNEQLISTLDEVMNIQREGALKRREAEAELGRIEGQLKQKLLELRG